MSDEQIAGLGKAIGHPHRVAFMRLLRERETLAPSEYAAERRTSLGVISYHCLALRKAQVIAIKKRVPRRGAMEHRYGLGEQGAAVLALIDSLDAGS